MCPFVNTLMLSLFHTFVTRAQVLHDPVPTLFVHFQRVIVNCLILSLFHTSHTQVRQALQHWDASAASGSFVFTGMLGGRLVCATSRGRCRERGVKGVVLQLPKCSSRHCTKEVCSWIPQQPTNPLCSQGCFGVRGRLGGSWKAGQGRGA